MNWNALTNGLIIGLLIALVAAVSGQRKEINRIGDRIEAMEIGAAK